jgi:hypothetical protein
VADKILPDVFIIINLADHKGKLPRDMLAWLEGNVGRLIDESDPVLLADGDGWFASLVGRINIANPVVRFRFYNPNHALMFKLSWGGM